MSTKLTHECDIKSTGWIIPEVGSLEPNCWEIPGLTLADGFTVKGIDVMKGPLRHWIRLQIVSYLLFCTKMDR